LAHLAASSRPFEPQGKRGRLQAAPRFEFDVLESGVLVAIGDSFDSNFVAGSQSE